MVEVWTVAQGGNQDWLCTGVQVLVCQFKVVRFVFCNCGLIDW